MSLLPIPSNAGIEFGDTRLDLNSVWVQSGVAKLRSEFSAKANISTQFSHEKKRKVPAPSRRAR